MPLLPMLVCPILISHAFVYLSLLGFNQFAPTRWPIFQSLVSVAIKHCIYRQCRMSFLFITFESIDYSIVMTSTYISFFSYFTSSCNYMRYSPYGTWCKWTRTSNSKRFAELPRRLPLRVRRFLASLHIKKHRKLLIPNIQTVQDLFYHCSANKYKSVRQTFRIHRYSIPTFYVDADRIIYERTRRMQTGSKVSSLDLRVVLFHVIGQPK